MQRAAMGEGDVVGDIDQRRDGAQANGFQTPLQPLRRGAVLDTPDIAADEQRAGRAVAILEIERHFDGRREGSGNWCRGERLQRAEALRREIARDAVDAQRIRTVRRHLHIDHWIVETQGRCSGRADRPVALKLDDAVVLVRDHQLALRAQHAL